MESPEPGATFGAVLPTFNRADALREHLPRFLEIEGLERIVVVNDCSQDDTDAVLARCTDARLTVIRNDRNRGSAVSRMLGVEALRDPWTLMLDDDCYVPNDFGLVLLEVAMRLNADIVGAPWVHTEAGRLDNEVAERRANGEGAFRLDTHPGVFPSTDIETPFIPGVAMVRRAVFDKVQYRRSYRGNAWREETDLFVSAERAGYRCVLTPRTYSYQTKQWSGGQRRGRLAYETWAFYNNWLFLARHGRYLADRGRCSPPIREQVRFGISRTLNVVRGHCQSRRVAR